ncbi:MAG: aminotransferase class I/II-fold pyridoxal phosphate-dependent enzyme [Cyanobacteria bacterium]|nr:aminotransferase class I/II-fold pyridoxal phosphate-dependent enzyme [Cyanobacteriota bacterium]MDA1020931.1 aminotransferase class I/II-fold pyridoxal phosphate-dependent enzyme [Cyanobacteriota bacterium]
MDLNKAFNSWLTDSGEYQAGKTFEYVMEKYGLKRSEIIRLAGNESTIGTSPKAIKAAQEAAASSNYYDEPQSESLIQALEQDFAACGLDMSKLGVVVGTGMDSIIEHCLGLFCDSSSSIVNYSPTFIYYDFAAKRKGIEVIDVPRTKPVTAILDAIQKNTKMVFLCSPNNPDGAITSFEDIEKLAANLLAKNIILFIDHAYIQFAEAKYDASILAEKYANLIIGFTFSKAYAMAGFRVGYGLMSKELQARYLKLNTPFLCAKASLAAAKVALEDDTHFNKIIENNNAQKPYLMAELIKLGYKPYESHANFILFEAKVKANEVLEKLMSQGIIIRAIPNVSDFALRVTIGKADENQKFIEALANV